VVDAVMSSFETPRLDGALNEPLAGRPTRLSRLTERRSGSARVVWARRHDRLHVRLLRGSDL